MPVRGAEIVSKNIVAFGGGFLKTVNKELKTVKKILDDKVTENITRTDYSLKDLAEMDHPFALRHGIEGKHIYEPYWMVHTRTGKLLKSKKAGINEASISGLGEMKASAWVKLDESKAKHALNVIYGTSKMIPRPVLSGSRDQVADQAIAYLRTKLKYLTVNWRAS